MTPKQHVWKPTLFIVGAPAEQIRIVGSWLHMLANPCVETLGVVGAEKVTKRNTELPAHVEYVDVWQRSLGHLRHRPTADRIESPLRESIKGRARPARGVRTDRRNTADDSPLRISAGVAIQVRADSRNAQSVPYDVNLFTLLLIVTVCCLPVAWLGQRIRSVQDQRFILEKLSRHAAGDCRRVR